MNRPASDMTIGTLAGRAGVNVETIRYYERIGLIARPDRPLQGFRRYPPELVSRIRFIKRAQELGFSLQEIAGLLALNDGDCEAARALAERKRVEVAGRIRDLQAIQRQLDRLIDACARNRDGSEQCAIIDALSERDG